MAASSFGMYQIPNKIVPCQMFRKKGERGKEKNEERLKRKKQAQPPKRGWPMRAGQLSY